MADYRFRLWLWASHKYLFPWQDGSARRKDPTHGQVDRDIQWFVHDIHRPLTMGERCAMESNLQRKRGAQC